MRRALGVAATSRILLTALSILAAPFVCVGLVVAQSGPGLWQVAPGTSLSQCINIGSPVTNRTWCADGNPPNYAWKVWNGSAYVTITGGGGGVVDAKYLLTAPNALLPSAINLGVLPAAILINDPAVQSVLAFQGSLCGPGQVASGITPVGGLICTPASGQSGIAGKQQFCNTATTAAITFGSPVGTAAYSVVLGTAPVSGTPPHVVADYNTPTVNGFNLTISDQPGAGNCVEVSWVVGGTFASGSGGITGNACPAGQFATAIANDGTLTCSGNTSNKIKTCTVIIGDPGAASPFLADDNDSPVACPNNYTSDWTITSVACWANAGSPTVTPILTGGTSTSILTGALTCGTASWAAGTLNGTPVVHSFTGGATCSVTPCSADVNITTAGGTAKYIVVKITGTL